MTIIFKKMLGVRITDNHFRFKFNKNITIKKERTTRGYVELDTFNVVHISDKNLVWNDRHVANKNTPDKEYVMFENCVNSWPLLFQLFAVLCMTLTIAFLVCQLAHYFFAFNGPIRAVSPSGEYVVRSEPGTPIMVLYLLRNGHWLKQIPLASHLGYAKIQVTDQGVIYWDTYIIYVPQNVKVEPQNSLIKLEQRITELTSPNGEFNVRFNPEKCGLIFIRSNSILGTTRYLDPYLPCDRLVFQKDNNLVAYDKNNKAVWASNTEDDGEREAELVLSDEGHLLLRWKDTKNLIKFILPY